MGYSVKGFTEVQIADCLSRLRHQEDSLVLEDENICVVSEEKGDMYLEQDLKRMIKLQDEDDYYELLKQLLKKGYDVDTLNN